MKTQNIQTSFTSGEISPLLLARVDLDRYKTGAKTLLNAHVLPHGPVKRRTGTGFDAEVRNSDRTVKLVPFVSSSSIATLLVLNDGYIQFFRNGSFIETSPSVRYQIAHTFTDSELTQFTYTQSGSVMYFAHNLHLPQELVRTNDTSWALSDYKPTYKAVTEHDYISDYLNFRIIAGTTAFAVGSEFTINTDGSGNVTTTPLTGTGNGTITSATLNADYDTGYAWKVTCTKSEGSGSTLRQEWYVYQTGSLIVPYAGWSPSNYPQAVAFHDQRLFFAGTVKEPHAMWMSKINDPEILTQGALANDGAKFTIAANQYDQIQHLVSTRQLLELTLGGEHSLTGSSTTGITPYSVKVQSQTAYGCSSVKPVKIGSEVLFIQRDSKKVRAVSYEAVQDSNTAIDLTIISEHITQAGIADMAYTQDPDQILWIVRSDGILLSLTRIKEQEVTSWARHSTGANGKFESVASIPDGFTDITYFAIQRTINGATKRFIEHIDYDTVTNTQTGAMTDCCLTGYDASAKAVWTGLDHLEGESVSIIADGKVHPNKTVSSGSVTLDYLANDIQVGIGYNTEIELLHPEPVVDRGVSASIGKTKIQKLYIHLSNTVNVQVTMQDPEGNEIRTETIASFKGGDLMDTAPELFSGIKDITGQGWTTPNNLVIKQSTPMPFTLLGVQMKVSINTA